MVNRIQNLRKDSGFEVTDRIDVKIQKEIHLEAAVKQNMKYIKQETLTNELQFEDEISNGIEIAFDDIASRMMIIKQ